MSHESHDVFRHVPDMRAVLVAELRLHWVCNFVILCRFQWDHVHFAELAPQILGDLFEDAVTLQLVEAWIYDQMAWRPPEIWKIWEIFYLVHSCTFLYILVHSCTALSMDRRWNKFDVV